MTASARDEDLRQAVQSGTVEALQLEGGAADRRVGGDGFLSCTGLVPMAKLK